MNVKKKFIIFFICFFNGVAFYVLAWSVTHKGTTRFIYRHVAIAKMSCKLEVFARPLTGRDLCRAMHAITRVLGYDGLIHRIKLR